MFSPSMSPWDCDTGKPSFFNVIGVPIVRVPVLISNSIAIMRGLANSDDYSPLQM